MNDRAADRICLITGATSGIGRATAQRLAADGATTVIVARDATKGEATAREITEATGNDRLQVLVADLSSQASIRALVEAFRVDHDRLDVLINCAGAFFRKRHVTADGLEMTFALNHLAYFLLTNLLLDQLRRTRSARVLNISAPATTKIDFDDLQAERRYRSLTVFGASKVAELMFTLELARRLEGHGDHRQRGASGTGQIEPHARGAGPVPVPPASEGPVSRRRGKVDRSPGDLPRVRRQDRTVLPRWEGDRAADVRDERGASRPLVGDKRGPHGMELRAGLIATACSGADGARAIAPRRAGSMKVDFRSVLHDLTYHVGRSHLPTKGHSLSSFLYRLGQAAARHRWRTLGIWIAAVVAIFVVGSALGGTFSNDFKLPDSESQRAYDLLAERYPAASGTSAYVVFHATGGPLEDKPTP